MSRRVEASQEKNSEVAVVCAAGSPFCGASERLARRLGVTLTAEASPGGAPAVALRITADGLQAEANFLPGAAPLRLDFTGGALGHRVRGAGGEMLIRALGGRGLQVLDGTGGLGRDAFLMARAGCTVTVCERNPVVHALLEDALQRAAQTPELADDVARIDLRLGDAAGLLRDAQASYDVVYLDPMFPERGKSAQVRKEQRLLQRLAGSDPEAPELVTLARRAARNRVVVKRPKGAPELQPGVHAALHARKIRFDLYTPVAR